MCRVFQAAVLCAAANQGRAISKSPPTAVCKPPLLGQKADCVLPDFNVTVHSSVEVEDFAKQIQSLGAREVGCSHLSRSEADRDSATDAVVGDDLKRGVFDRDG